MRKILMAFVAIASSSCIFLWDDWGEARFATVRESQPASGEKSIRVSVRLNIGTLEVEPGPADQAYELDLEYNELAFEPQLSYEVQDQIGRLHFELSGEGRSVAKVVKTRLNLRLNPEIPLDLQAATGVGESQIDLSGMTVKSLRLENGVGETELFLLKPNRSTCEHITLRSGVGSLKVTGLGNLRFEHLDFQGGVGGSTLDFSGSWDQAGSAEIDVGIGGIEILLPRNIGAEVEFSKSFLSNISLSGFQQRGRHLYVSDNIEQADKILRLKIRAGIGGVDIRWI